ncbi:MAG: DUF58 domain-containing protein, partial [Acidimicrobiales bacterium]
PPRLMGLDDELVPGGAVLRALELSVRRKVDGVLAGDHRSLRLGQGTELAQIRPYVPGDDVRKIDWNATARTGQPHVRVHVAERALTTWLVLDVSASMAWGTADRTKADVASGACLAVAHAATRGVNRVGIVTFGGAEAGHRPPSQGRHGLLAVSSTLRQMRGHHAAGVGTAEPAEDLAAALQRTGRVARSRSLIVVISDLRADPERTWRAALLGLAARHDVVVAEVLDAREQSLPAVGELTLVDPETGRLLRVDTSSRRLRERFAAAAAAERAAVAAAVTGAGADHVVLTTEGDWLLPLASFLSLREGTTA